jgi:AraC family transcriptional regulator, transcriptional activator of pobA
MKEKSQIIQFKEMNDFYQYIGLKVRSFYPEFHIYRFEDFDENCRFAIPPHTKDFYQISFIKNYGNSQQEINSQVIQDAQSVFYFISPEHIYSWKRDERISGYILNFKAEGLPIAIAEFNEKFACFDLNKSNVLFLNSSNEQKINQIFKDIYEEYSNPSKIFFNEILKHYLLVLLYKCMSIYNEQQKSLDNLSTENRLFIRYKNLIHKFYLNKRSLSEYADLLDVSPNYLSTSIKKASGKSAAYFITNRLVVEARNLLKYSDMDIKEICYALNFSDPTHFGKFFKKNVGITPMTYRNDSNPKNRL